MALWRNVSSVDDVWAAYHSFLDLGDERVSDMFLMQSPIPVTLISLSYTYFVLYLGPKLMMDRKPFNLKGTMMVYNIFQVIFNSVVFVMSVRLWIQNYGWGLTCLPLILDPNDSATNYMAPRLCHLYFINKIIDLLDTVFFVLKKKNNHISVLHVFHHAVMPFSVWFGVKFHPGGNLSFFGLANLFVHIWMYLYYLLALMGPEYQKYTWWKRHLTELQLAQFAIVGVYVSYVSCVCNQNKYFVFWITCLDVIFAGLFINFYIKSYQRRRIRKDIKMRPIKSD